MSPFGPKKKKLGESIGFGGGGRDAAPPKYSAGGAGSAGSTGVATTSKTSNSDLSAENDKQEGEAGEAAELPGGAGPVATPESVNYRTEAETCQNCEYMQGSNCSFLQQPVGAADSCNRFESKGEDMMGASAGAGSAMGAPGGGAGGELSGGY